MALYALDEKVPIIAWDATPGKTYRCIECSSFVKMRKSKLRLPHFYHLKTSPSCRLYSKSEEHLLIQLEIKKTLPEGEAFLEKPFPPIHRIADLVWEPKKLIFEIQCSMISDSEVAARIKEYGSLGYEVVWILEDRLFNQKILSAAEIFLRQRWCYFYNKSLKVYDQFEIVAGRRRLWRSKKMAVDCKSLSVVSNSAPCPSQYFATRLANCGQFFVGDLIDRGLNSPRMLENWAALEIHFQDARERRKGKNLFEKWIKEPYTALLKKFL